MNFTGKDYYLGNILLDLCDNMQIIQRKIKCYTKFVKIIYSKLEIITINLHNIQMI
jgi:hypothetical protein